MNIQERKRRVYSAIMDFLGSQGGREKTDTELKAEAEALVKRGLSGDVDALRTIVELTEDDDDVNSA